MRIIDTIRKLIEHEKSCRSIGNIAEAEAFAAKIQDLMMKNKLSMSDVELTEEPFGHETGHPSQRRRQAAEWSSLLAVAAARACFCNAVTCAGTNGMIFVGRTTDRAIAIGMWRFLVDLAQKLFKDDLPALRKVSKMHPARARNRYLIGFAHAIVLRLQRERRVAVAASGEAGIVRVDSESRKLAEFQSRALQTRAKAIGAVRDSTAFRAGFARGVVAPLRKQFELEASSV